MDGNRWPLDDGWRDGRFRVDGRDETNAPELVGLGWRRAIGMVIALVAMLLIGLAMHVGAGLAVAFAFQAGVIVFFATERATIGSIRRRQAQE